MSTQPPMSESRRRLVLGLISLYAVLLPFPVTITLSPESEIRTGPADVVLILLVIFGLSGATFVRKAWSRWHVAVLFTPVLSAVGVVLLDKPLGLGVLLAKVFGIVSLFVLYLILTSALRSWDDIRMVARRFVNIVIWLNLTATVLFVSRIYLPPFNIEPRRLSGLNPDPNAYGGMLIVALAMAIPTLQSKEPLVRGRISQMALLIMPLSILLTNSRSSWIGLGVVFLIVAVTRPRIWLRYVIAASLVLLVVGVFVAPELATDQLTLAGRGSSSRFQLITETSEAFWSSPIFGIGIGQFVQQNGIIIHSTPAWWFGEFGILGFTIMVGFLATFFRWAWSVYRTQLEPNRSLALGVFIAFVAMVVFSLGIEALYQRWWWLAMAFIGSMRAVSAQTQPTTAPWQGSPGSRPHLDEPG